MSINIREIYPQVTYPVPISTPMIAPFWRWDHTLDWPVIDGKLLASGGGGSIAATASFTVDPFSPDSKVCSRLVNRVLTHTYILI